MNWMYWHLVCTCNLDVYKLLTFNNINLAIFTFLRTRQVQIYRFILVYNYMNLFFHLFSYLYVTGCLIFFWLPPVSCSSLEFLNEVIFFIIFAFSLILTDNNSFEWFVAAIALQNAFRFQPDDFLFVVKNCFKNQILFAPIFRSFYYFYLKVDFLTYYKPRFALHIFLLLTGC